MQVPPAALRLPGFIPARYVHPTTAGTLGDFNIYGVEKGAIAYAWYDVTISVSAATTTLGTA